MAFVFPEDHGAIGDGVADDTSAVQSALNAGIVSPTPWARYRISESLVIPDGGGIVGIGRTARFIMDASGFNHASELLGTRFDANAVGIIVKGQLAGAYTPHQGCILKDFILESEVLDGRVLKGIAVLNALMPVIQGVEIFGLPVSSGICLNSVIDGVVEHNYIHDCTTNVSGFALPQITGIEVDNDLVNGVLSSNININFNKIKNLTVGQVTLSEKGYQTDGINIAREGTISHKVIGNYIENVGEGIDSFGDGIDISHNTIKNAYVFGIKIIHGGRRSIVSVNSIDGAGLAGITASGSTSAENQTERNLICQNIIERINFNGAWNANDTAGIKTEDNGGTTKLPCQNFIAHNQINCGGTGKYGIFAGGSGALDLIRDNRVMNATVAETFGNFADIRSADKAVVRVAFNASSAAQNIACSLGGAPSLDVQEEWVGNVYTAKAHRLLLVSAQVRTALSPGYELRCVIRKNGSSVALGGTTSSGGAQIARVQDVISVKPGDTISFAWLHTDPVARSISADSSMSFMSIAEVG